MSNPSSFRPYIAHVKQLDLHCRGINKLPRDIRTVSALWSSFVSKVIYIYINTIQFIRHHFHQYSSLLQPPLLSGMPSPKPLSLLTEVPRMILFFLRRTSAFPSRPCTAYAKRLYTISQTYLAVPISRHELTTVRDHYIPNTKIRYFPTDLNKHSHRRKWGHYPALANYFKRWSVSVTDLIE